MVKLNGVKIGENFSFLIVRCLVEGDLNKCTEYQNKKTLFQKV